MLKKYLEICQWLVIKQLLKPIIIINNNIIFIYIRFLFKLDVKNYLRLSGKLLKYTILVFQMRKLRFRKVISLDQGLKTCKL